MTIFEFAVTYAVCWWLVLFMVLPHQADAAKNPEVGHAPSAPARPQLGKKARWTTLLAFIPAIALYFVVEAAHAEETIYHAGSGCKPLAATSASDVNARDGYSTGGKKVKPATLESKTILGDKDSYDIPLRIPTQGYIDPAGTPVGRNVDLSQSFVGVGDLNVKNDGGISLNGKPIAPQEVYPEGCEQPADKETPETPKK